MAVKLSKKTLWKAFCNYGGYACTVHNYERMQGSAFCAAMCQAADELYPGNADQQQKLAARHTQFFNSHVVTGMMAVGLALGMEEERANGADVSDDLIASTKSALMGPLAGIGDSLISGTYIPILLSIALGMCVDTGSIVGPIFYAATWLITSVALGWFLLNRGYKTGIKGVSYLMSSGVTEAVVRAASIVGIFIIGCITGQYVTADFAWTFASGDLTISLASKINSVLPGTCSILLTMFAYWLLDKKKLKVGWLFLIFIGIALVGSLIGLLG